MMMMMNGGGGGVKTTPTTPTLQQPPQQPQQSFSLPPPPIPNNNTTATNSGGGGSINYLNYKTHFDKETVAYVLEDNRLSTLQKKLIRETNVNVSLALAFEISSAIIGKDNRNYVRRSNEVLIGALVEVLRSRRHQTDVKVESANAIGKTGFVMAEQGMFYAFYEWLWKGFREEEEAEEVGVYFLKSLSAFLHLRPKLTHDQILRVMTDVMETMESTQSPAFMMSLVDSLSVISLWKSEIFEPKFVDTVDMIVGWSLDPSQSAAVRGHLSKILLSWSSFWILDLDFSAGLLRHFMEDMEEYRADIEATDRPRELLVAFEKVLALLHMFNTCLGCLQTPKTTVSILPPESVDWFEAILKGLLLALEKRFDEDLMVVGQQSVIMMLNRLDTLYKLHETPLHRFMEMNVTHFAKLTYHGQAAVMDFLRKMFVTAESPKQPLVLNIILPQEGSPTIARVAYLTEKKVRSSGIDLFKVLLDSKSILVLQEVYGCLTGLLKTSLEELSKNGNLLTRAKERQSRALFFVLSAISNLAATKGSVLSLWALDPSIFSLLADRCQLTEARFITSQPWIHHALFKALHAHCSTHSQFLSSTNLIPQNQTLSSPTSQNFSKLLSVLTSVLRVRSPCDATMLLALHWSQEILVELSKNQQHLLDKMEFVDLIKALICVGEGGAEPLVMKKVLEILECLIKTYNLEAQNEPFLFRCLELSKFLMKSTDKHIVEMAMKVYFSLPPLMLDWQDVKKDPAFLVNRNGVKGAIAQHGSSSSVSASDFKIYIEGFLRGPLDVRKQLDPKVTNNLQMRLDKNDAVKNQLLYEVFSHEDFKVLWTGFEAAQYCINNKLKTPLGKAQDTLTTIEKTLRNIAQRSKDGTVEELSHKKCNDLLIFFECLERCMHNSFGGSALFMAPPSKVVSTFFVANKKTCVDWLSRLRSTLVQVAFMAENYPYVIRNAQYALEYLTASTTEKNDKAFLQIVVMHAIALSRLGCPDALQGLYVWCKKKTGKKFTWIQPLIKIVQKKSEEGLALYKNTIKEILDMIARDEADAFVYKAINTEMGRAFWHLGQFDEYVALLEKYKDQAPGAAASGSSQQEKDFFGRHLKALGEFSELGISQRGLGRQYMDEVFSTDTLLHSTHQFLLEQAPSFPYLVSLTWSEPEKMRDILSEVQERINLLLTDHTLLKEGEQLLRIMELVRCELHCVIENKEGSNLDRLLSFRTECHSSKQLVLIKQWGNFFIRHKKNNANYFFHLSALDLEIAKAARREENFNLAKTYLSKVLIGGPKTNLNLDAFISAMDFSGSLMTAERASCIRQCAKISYKWKNKQSAVNYLTSLVGGISHNFPADSFHSQYFEVCSRSLHTMAKWFSDDPSLIERVYPDTSNKITLDHVLAVEQQAIMHHLDFLPMVESATDNDMVVGRLLRLSVIQSPQLAKLWNSFADWALDMGEKFLASCERESIGITDQERQFVMELVPEATVSQFEEIFQLLQHYRLQHSEKGEIELNRLEYMKKELRSCSGLAGSADDIIEHINKIWAAMQKRTFFFHETAIRAYFQFIMQSDGVVQEDKLIAATLRILQLTVKHSLELQECLQEGLEATPSGNWRAIIPQLFSRLNHPVRIVRARISELLCRIAQDYPHMIIYPAVVGAASSKKDKFARLLTQPVDEVQEVGGMNGGSSSPVLLEEDEEESSSQGMQGAYEQIVDMMTKQCGPAVEQVQKFVAELQRISVLWDELWLGSLQQHGNEVIRRAGKMEMEVQKLSRNRSLSDDEKKLLVLDKYNIIFKPLLYVFEKVYSLTNKEPETPHEKWFIKKYGPFIANMMKKIRNPTNPAKPKDSWELLGQLQNNLAGKLHLKTNLKMSEISPTLHEMKGSEIPMPGIPGKAALKIQHLDNDLNILLTKTKPKRLAFHGNDGRKYSYLFKGLEDLHLDERIMQFLSIANIMMKKSGKEYKARHYSVVPLGPRSGLIQWVGGSVPLYTLYKKWQQRHQMTRKPGEKAGGPPKKLMPVQKPTEMFYNKLLPILKENGVTNLESRKDWPAATLKQAMQELIDETPDTLISQELWFASSDAQHWFTLMQNLTRSIAVMSVIGYIIGLGDRHLDNLLLDIQKGEVIHIDYNVCFEKGKHLRIPERAPCRLTQNIVRIFGLTGVEGLFRASCEHTLETMRQGRETLITLLEAFVYDPLVDWTPGVDTAFSAAFHGGNQQDLRPGVGGGDSAQNKREMQAEITFSMFAVRIAEIKTPWLENKALLFSDLTSLEDKLGSWMDIRSGVDGLHDKLAKMHQSMSILKEAESNPNHRLYNLYERYVEHSLAENAVAVSKSNVKTFIDENEKWINLFQRAMANLTENQLSKWSFEIQESGAETAGCKSGDLIKDFLENAGQIPLLEQFQTVEAAFCMGLDKMKQSLTGCLQLLGHYSTVSSLYPQSFKQNHRSFQYIKWAKVLSENFSVETCSDIIKKIGVKYVDNAEEKQLKHHHVVNINFQMESWGQEIGFRIQSICTRMLKENIDSSTGVYGELGTAKMDLQQCLQAENEASRCLFQDLMIPNLANLAKKLLGLETMAAEANENLVDLTSSDGEWFLLDEIQMDVGISLHMLDLLDFYGLLDHEDPRVECIQKLGGVVKSLQHFNSSYFGIVLQEGLKSFTREDPTVLAIAEQLNVYLEDTGYSIETLLQELDVKIRYTASDLETQPADSDPYMAVIRTLKANYDKLVSATSANGGNSTGNSNTTPGKGQQQQQQQQKGTRDSGLDAGQMLFLAFDALFNNIDHAVVDLNLSASVMEVPEEWLGIDAVSEAKKIVSANMNPALSEQLSLLAFLNRIMVIKEYFSLCQRSLVCFKADPESYGQMLPNGDEMARPVKHFQAEYFLRQVNGYASYCLSAFVCHFIRDREPKLLTNLPDKHSTSKLTLEELAKAYIDGKLTKSSSIGLSDKARYFELEIENLSKITKKVEVAKYLEQNIDILQASLSINQLQRHGFQWFHENDLTLEPMSILTPARITVMTDLRNAVSLMALTQNDVNPLLQKMQELHSTVEQRLKWACGANPELQDVFDTYSTVFNTEIGCLKTLNGVMKSVLSTANAVWHLEALRTQTREAVNTDSAFMALVGECQQSASIKDGLNSNLSDQELMLFSLSPPKDMINLDWIRGSGNIIALCVKKIQRDMNVEQKKIAESVKDLHRFGLDLKTTVGEHHKLMSDVAQLLSTIFKSEDYHIPEVNEYILKYKEFQNLISAVVTTTSFDDQTEESMKKLSTSTNQIKGFLEEIYEELIGFSSLLREENLENFKVKKVETVKEEEAKEARKKTSSEEKNSFALTVLRRIRVKLEGREPDALKRSSVQEQVDFIIRESTSIDNLAHMYEGWTAWI